MYNTPDLELRDVASSAVSSESIGTPSLIGTRLIGTPSVWGVVCSRYSVLSLYYYTVVSRQVAISVLTKVSDKNFAC